MNDVEQIQTLIGEAFAGVHLEDDVSLKQAQAYDIRLKGISEAEFNALPNGEETDDWRAIPFEALENDDPCLPFLDANGFRYYIPALTMSLLDHYDPLSLRVIGTIGMLDPRGTNADLYASTSNKQKGAIASFLQNLPHLVELDYESGKIIERAYNAYWIRYLPADNDENA